MAPLTVGQDALARGLVHRASTESEKLASILLIGPHGVGKRTVARGAAALFDKEFVGVSVAGRADVVAKDLFGDRVEAEQATEGGSPPGEVGRASSKVLYLSDIDMIDRALLGPLRTLITRRTYVDALGAHWKVSDDTLLTGGTALIDNDPGRLSIIRSFDSRIYIDSPKELSEIFFIASAIASEYGVGLDEAAKRALQPALQTRDHLHAVRRWVERACVAATGLPHVSESQLASAMVQDYEWLLERVPYRGRVLGRKHFEKWLRQFLTDLQGIAIDLLRSIADTYYISASAFHEGLAHLIEQTQIRRGHSVVFCRWQTTGDSATHMAHLIKTQAGWRNDFELDLNQSPTSWPAVDRSRAYDFVVVDDFAGSGRTIRKLFAGPIPVVLEAFPTSHFWLLILAGFDHGLREIMPQLKPFGNRVRLHVYRTSTDADRCFTSASRLLVHQEEREKLRAFCNSAASEHMPGLSRNLTFGFRESGAVVVFYEWVPNNTLPLFWYDSDSWHALFPRSGLVS